MRVTAWSVDGFGVHRGFDVEGLPEGLTVVYGENESGKTTLSDFLRGVLFGFPDRRSRSTRHLPLAGGRHGGRVELESADGERMVVERYVGGGAPTLSFDHRGLGAPGELEAYLGAADGALFGSVFAFGLDELHSLSSLERDELRDQLFSAGVIGAGRTANAALRVLDERRSQIVRPRRADARANRAGLELDSVERDLRAARARMTSYPAIAGEIDGLAAVVDGRAGAVRRVEHRLARIGDLRAAWPAWSRRADARAELEALQDIEQPPGSRSLASLGPHVAELAARLSGYQVERERQASLGRSRASLRQALGDDLARLGSRFDLQRARAVDTSAASLDRLRARSREVTAAEVAEVAQRDRAELAAVASDRAQARCRGTEPAGRSSSGAPPQPDSPDSSGRATPSPPAPAPAPRRRGRLPLVVAVALLVAGSGAAALASAPLIAVCLLIAAAGAAAALASVIAAARPATPPSRLSPTAIDRLEQALGAERELRAILDEDLRHAADAAAEAERERRLLRGRIETLGEARVRWRHAVEEVGLDPDLTVDEVLARFEDASRLKGHLEALGRVEEELERVASSTADLEADVEDAYEAAGLELPTGGLQCHSAVRVLEERVLAAVEHRLRVARLAEEIAAADRQLAAQLGSGPQRDALLEELASRAPAEWDEESRALAARREELAAEHEAAVRAHQDTLRVSGDIADGDTLARLELRRVGLEAELACELRQWLALSLARSLIETTLSGYERERQPAVVRRAAALFAEVTGGRYVRLLPRAAGESARERGIVAVDARGQLVDSTSLSRGTVEQLYLCLRLALAEVFAETAVALPFLMDDVLVNFDPGRARAMARVVASLSRRHQVIFLTCHPHVLELLRVECPTLRLVALDGPDPADASQHRWRVAGGLHPAGQAEAEAEAV